MALSLRNCCLAVMLLAGIGSESAATTVLSNLGVDQSSGQFIANNHTNNVDNVAYVGAAFKVGPVAGNAWNLDSATLSMDDTYPATTGNFVVGIYSSTLSGLPQDARPGTLLGTLSGSASPLTAGEYVYTAGPGGIALTAGETYWLVASAVSTTAASQGYFWKLADGTAPLTAQASGWEMDASHFMATFGTDYATDTGTWNDNPAGADNIVYRTSSASGSALNWGGDEFLQFSLSASVAGAPEPTKAMFGLLGLLALGLRRRRG